MPCVLLHSSQGVPLLKCSTAKAKMTVIALARTPQGNHEKTISPHFLGSGVFTVCVTKSFIYISQFVAASVTQTNKQLVVSDVTSDTYKYPVLWI